MIKSKISKWSFVAVFGVCGSISVIPGAMATSAVDYANTVRAIRVDSKLGVFTPEDEADLIKAAKNDYWKEQTNTTTVGDVLINGASPVYFTGPGTTVTLTFDFVDPSTGLPTTGPTVASVEYMANLDPNTATFVPIGTSTAAEFAFSFTVSGFEPQIIGIPLDEAGAPIVIEGFGGANDAPGLAVALLAPEPSTYLLMGVGFAALAAGRRFLKGSGRAGKGRRELARA